MLKLFKKFLKLGNSSSEIKDENINAINSSWQYKKLSELSLKNNIKSINDFIYFKLNKREDLLNDYMDQSIIDGDLVLFKGIFLNRRKFNIGTTLSTDDMLHYARKACKQDKENIFEYIIEFYHSTYSGCCSYDSDFQVKILIDDIIDLKKLKYFEILEKYDLTNFNTYISSSIESSNKIGRIEPSEINRIAFLMEEFPNKINKEDLLKEANSYKNTSQKLIELIENYWFFQKKHESKKLFEELNNEFEKPLKEPNKKRQKL
jgi:hypothetical protein